MNIKNRPWKVDDFLHIKGLSAQTVTLFIIIDDYVLASGELIGKYQRKHKE